MREDDLSVVKAQVKITIRVLGAIVAILRRG
jgi:hypothetical protein